METFLNKYYALINFGVVFLPAIVGLVLYKKYKGTAVKYFIWFCFFVAFIEIIGAYEIYIEKIKSLHFLKELISESIFENSNWWYLIFWTLGGALFYSFYYRNLISSWRLKNVIKYSAILYFLFFTFSFVKNFNEIPYSAQIPINIAESILIVVAVLAYFMEILRSDKILSIFSSVHFYIAAVVLLWHIIMTPLIFYEMYFNKFDMDYAIMKAMIYLSCNTLMYLTFSFALIWCKPQNT